MKRLFILMAGVLFSATLFTTDVYADDTSDNLKKASDILDILAEDEDKDKHKDGPGNSKNARDNHGQNKKK